jgi:hypothetical protein
MERREFLRALGGSAIGLAAASGAFGEDSVTGYVAPVPADTGASGQVVVIGGGMAGATVAKYLRVWGGAKVKVTLVERESVYVSNIMSNLVLNGSRTISGLTYNWDKLASNYGIDRVQGEVVGVDRTKHQVVLATGAKLGYDKLVIAPGIDFDRIPGIDTDALQARFPHAWKAGAQTTTLRDQIRAMTSRDTFVMTIPKAPYRCPPGPYERACVVADWLKRNRRGAQVIVLDENAAITAETASFERAFTQTHAGVITYVPNAIVNHIDPGSSTVFTAMGEFKGKVINPIPRQRAPRLLYDVRLVNDTGVPGQTVGDVRWSLVDPKTYEFIDNGAGTGPAPDVHIIGDPANHGLPKAGHVANQEAKVCADAITRMLRGDLPDQNPVTNSACYSPITFETASWLTAVYRYNSGERKMETFRNDANVLAAGEAASASKDNFEQMNKWFRQLMADTYA